MAISHANWILDASENLADESERPKHWMWAHDELMEAHFERVRKAREEKYGGKKKEEESENMMANELAEQYRR